MKAETVTSYRGRFRKKNGKVRVMRFVRMKDLPKSFLVTKVKGKGSPVKMPKNFELVWDIEKDNFRYFNHDELVGSLIKGTHYLRW